MWKEKEKKKEVKYFTKAPPFINRKEEKKYLLEYLNSAPTNILFLYWPKSTGKTTLIYKIINEELDNKKFDVNFINLRSVLMTNFKDFKNLFFPKDLMWKVKNTLWTIWEIWAFWFSWNAWEENILETNVFGLMEDKLRKLNKQWIKPVIILDEFQYLKNIFIDSKKEVKLIEELFKFFISITKQFNLAHVICSTSDSYFLEELYNDTKLANTSDFYMIDHLSKKDIYYWLDEKEDCPAKMVKDVWENLGWSIWEIWQVLVSYKNTGDYKKRLQDLLDVKYSIISEWKYLIEEKLDELKPEDNEYLFYSKKLNTFINVIKWVVKKWYYLRSEWVVQIELIKELVDKDIWFYDIKKWKITANSESVRKAFDRILG